MNFKVIFYIVVKMAFKPEKNSNLNKFLCK